MNEIVKKTLSEMLHDRSYTNIQIMDDNIMKLQNERHEPVLIYNSEDDKTGVKIIKKVIDIVHNNDIKHLIFIYKKVITIFAKNLLDELLESIYIELFSETELSYNVSTHCLVPKHKLVPNEEVNDIVSKYKCSLTNFPVILKTDPICRYYGFRRGHLIEITRSSETNGTYICYRLVL